ncbi:aminodeoxychorismate synthase component I [Terrihabitans sp. B22-R8]|uniref:aminodeoxychorismate synthase component I n=1 Tax=Terrihabitans sp. B22-R8 TaxID=3425128 RepID=UPI00403D32A3
MIAAGTVLLHDNLSGGPSRLFRNPRRVLTTRRAGEVVDLIGQAEQALADGWHLAGTLSYEMGFQFEERLAALLPAETDAALMWLGVYDAPETLGPTEVWNWIGAACGPDIPRVDDLRLPITRDAYAQAFARVKAYIAAGDVYQINLTMPAIFRLSGDPVSFYRDLCLRQRVAHGALINTGEQHILSLSPELFVENEGGRLTTRPMKGTIARGASPEEDAAQVAHLRADEKTRAENLMIVDLLRNDLGRIAEMGSVEVDDLFAVETYASLHQMVSNVHASMRPGTGFRDVLQALFPCGSVTGAPKIRAMQIIHEIEAAPRGVYTGSVGWAAPDGDFRFNVAIRTALIESDGQGRIGIGGGVVADSTMDAEYDEALLKLDFLRDVHAPFGLIETLQFNGAEYWLLERHIARLKASAEAFAMPFDEGAVRTALAREVEGVSERRRVRLVLGENGEVEATSAPLGAMDHLRFALCPRPMRSTDRLLHHKTTRRAIYDVPRAEMARQQCVDEVLFANERGELTEGSFTNLFVRRGGVLLTPALSCGLLPGTLRAELLETGEAREAVLTTADLAGAEAIFLGNSVRGMVPATYVRV